MKLIALVEQLAGELEAAGVSFGHGTTNAFDEAVWLVLWHLGCRSTNSTRRRTASCCRTSRRPRALLRQRITTRKPAAYLTREAWLQGMPFYVDERAIVPRSFIAELLADGSIDPWLSETHRARAGPVHRQRQPGRAGGHVLSRRAGRGGGHLRGRAGGGPHQRREAPAGEPHALLLSDGLAALPGPYDLILCNPPYVNAQSMAALPPEYRAEPALALAGGADGMDFIRTLLQQAPSRMSEAGVLVLEIGNERRISRRRFRGWKRCGWRPARAPTRCCC
jgi:ribosomal protein L3 glutamine methyltransferase